MDTDNQNNPIALLDDRQFVAPRSILEMYQRISFPSFKVWASLLADITEKNFSDKDQLLPLSVLWQTLDGRLSHKRLEKLTDELQTTLIKKDEYLPQTQERKHASFSLLGPTEITVDNANEVTSLKYRFVKELLQVLETETDKELFVIEMRTIISLKGQGGEHAKNLLLLCTPHVSLGETPFIELNELRKFMRLQDKYQDSDGDTSYKTFNRHVLKKAISALTANPYLTFDIEKINVEKKNGKTFKISFVLKERRSIKNLLSESIDDHSSPVNPEKLKSTLVSFWAENLNHSYKSYPILILEKLLRQFRFVDKYIENILDLDAYEKRPTEETYRIFSIATAITQLWLSGNLDKSDSKIYNYAYKIFTNPKQGQIDDLVQKFIMGAGLSLEKPVHQIAVKNDLKRQQKSAIDQLTKCLASYDRIYSRKTLDLFTPVELIELDCEFAEHSMEGRFGVWAKKAILGIEDLTVPLLQSLTRRTLLAYKDWLTKRAASMQRIPDKSIKDFIKLFPDLKRNLSFLNIPLEIDYFSFIQFVKVQEEKHKTV